MDALDLQPALIEAALKEQAARKRGDYHAEILRRARFALELQRSPGHQRAVMLVMATDPVMFINDWIWTYDPRNISRNLPPVVPFVLRPTQERLIRWLQEREATQSPGMIEKSRDEGMSYVVLAYFLHRWLFTPGFAAGVGSRKEEYVDRKGDPKSLFWKFRDMLSHLPSWMMPAGFSPKLHDNHMRIINPANGASLTGEAGDNIGRGGRTTIYLLDEWAFVDHPESVNAAISQNTNVVIKGSTPNGVGNVFYTERFSGRFPVFTMHWKDNPDKNFTLDLDGQTVYPWYKKQEANLDPIDLAQEVDIDYTASTEGIVIPAKWVNAAFQLVLPAGLPRVAGVDVAEEGADKSAYAARAGGVVLPSLRQLRGLHVAADLVESGKADGISELNYDKLGVGASLTATLAKLEDLPFTVRGIANSERPSRTVYPDAEARAEERFANLAAELWWRLRLRFKNTYERETLVKYHPDEECISLAELKGHPLENTVRAQLSQATYEKAGVADKIRVNKKGKGTASPDLAEVIMYAFAPSPPPPAQVYVPGTYSQSL
ncbi:terminase [Deinococcus irradiatisoli]|uniref:terminase n=1 Tax=Deinococcus irradiatisoli TaxID=2202254 RepID=UPI0015E84F77|nr:terminase [Deinococcus irradiatisoli]